MKGAFADFSAYKASGPDGIKPVVLHNLPDMYLSKLLTIYEWLHPNLMEAVQGNLHTQDG